MPKKTRTTKKQESPKGTLLALMSYVPFLGLVPLFMERENEFVHLHAKQGFLLFVVEIFGLLFFLVLLLLFGFVPILRYLFFNFFFSLFLLAILIIMALGIYFVLRGESKEIPWLGDLAKKLKF